MNKERLPFKIHKVEPLQTQLRPCLISYYFIFINTGRDLTQTFHTETYEDNRYTK